MWGLVCGSLAGGAPWTGLAGAWTDWHWSPSERTAAFCPLHAACSPPAPHFARPQSPKKVGDDIQAATKEWKGIKVIVKITIQNRQAGVDVIPTTAPLILKALGVCRDRKKVKEIVHDGNLTMDQVIDIARTMRASSQAREFSGTVKEVLGTCFSIGCSVNGKHPRDIQGMIDSGDVTVGDA